MLPVNSWTPINRFCSVRNIGFLRHHLHYASDCYYFYYDYESRSEEHLGVIRGKALQDARNGGMPIWLFSLTHDACCLSLILHVLIKIIVLFFSLIMLIWPNSSDCLEKNWYYSHFSDLNFNFLLELDKDGGLLFKNPIFFNMLNRCFVRQKAALLLYVAYTRNNICIISTVRFFRFSVWRFLLQSRANTINKVNFKWMFSLILKTPN